jgi:glycosyltransferase involved in cell wall biosynthesis
MKSYSSAFNLNELRSDLLLQIKEWLKKTKFIINDAKKGSVKQRESGSARMSVSYITPMIKSGDKHSARNEEKENFFLLISTIDQQENLKVLLRAFSSKEIRGHKLIIVTKEKSESFHLIEWVKSTNVTIINSFDKELVGYLFKKANAFINCSSNDLSRLIIIEAINNNCRLVLSDIPAFKMIKDEKTTYFDPLSESSIINAILSVPEKI